MSYARCFLKKVGQILEQARFNAKTAVNLPMTDTGRKFFLSWSHYIKLMRIENVDNTQIFASKYQTVLPSKEELQRLLNATD